MIIVYSNKETESICNDSHCAQRKFNMDVAKKLPKLMYYLSSYEKFSEFRSKLGKKYNVHELHKDKRFSDGTIALDINYSFRMTIKVLIDKLTDTITILEVSNHYGD